MKRAWPQATGSGSPRRAIADMRPKVPRPIQSSPSSGVLGNPARNQAGTWMGRPPRLMSRAPSQRARTPSSFSLTQ
jgi:hypothetical protein